MVYFPNAKINLGLNILAKRPDGYHDLESCFYPVAWREILEIIPSKLLKFSSSGIDIPGDASQNLCLKAYRILSQDFDLPAVHIHLHKHIPIGAGLGGGSADGAFTLKALNELHALGLSTTELESYAAQLGSDCPFFIENKAVLAKGRGTEFEEISTSLQGKSIVLVMPPIHVSTAEAYSNIRPRIPEKNIRSIIESLPLKEWKYYLKNDFEEGVFKVHPSIAHTKSSLYELGAVYASMSGSGAAVYGIFEGDIPPGFILSFPHCSIWQGTLV